MKIALLHHVRAPTVPVITMSDRDIAQVRLALGGVRVRMEFGVRGVGGIRYGGKPVLFSTCASLGVLLVRGGSLPARAWRAAIVCHMPAVPPWYEVSSE